MEISSGITQKFSRLPFLRFTSIVIIFTALDSLICISLWIAGGDSLYMEDSVTDYLFTHSTFDLACISVLRGLVVTLSFYFLERYSLLRVSVGKHDKQRVGTRVVIFCLFLILLVSGLSILYAIVKGSLILKSILQGTWNNVDVELQMHVTYKVLCIVSIVFPMVEIILGILSLWCIQRMIRIKKLHLLVNMEEDDNQKPKKNKANIKRIILLAKAVRFRMYVVHDQYYAYLRRNSH